MKTYIDQYIKMPARKQTGKGTLGDVANFIRNQKLISKGLGMIPHPAAQAASQIAGLVGLGKPKKKKKKQTGKGIFGDLGGGIGSALGGLGGGVGSALRGLFGGKRGKKKKVMKL
jgi:hypothetical protein